MAKVLRHKIADYLETTPAAGQTPAVNSLMGSGFTALDEYPRARVEKTAYIADASATGAITGYENRFAFDTQLLSEDAAIGFLYDIARGQKTGTDAETYLYRVELYKTPTDGAYPARKFRVAVEIADVRGAGGEIVRITGNLHQVGNLVEGMFNPTSRTFVAND